ncbi:Ribosome production factor 2-like protein [Aphelenchoides besseyi]|nr:Ribosome production factor 2-like protein [Aphelenchoides besseyi]KAI6207820.1 Ribosome production factor 2-like protein [Aphelenchoides besseyi]
MSSFVRKAKTRRGKKHLENRIPKVIENDKTALLLKGGKTNEKLTKFLQDIYLLKNPLAQKLQQKNPIHLFEDSTFIEKMSEKYDASLFLMVSKSKRHPDTVTLGRLFDYQLLDLVDLQLIKYKPPSEFKQPSFAIGTKPCITLQGLNFENDENFKKIGNMLVDFFRGPVIPKVRLQGLEMVMSFTATEEHIYMRTYRSVLKKSDDTVPRVELIEVGPSADFQVVRHKFASDNLMKKAMKKPKELKRKMRKNTSQDVFGTKHGRIHLGRQNVNNIQTRKVKALRKTANGHVDNDTQ